MQIEAGLTVDEFESLVEKFVLERNKRYILYDETHGPHPAIMQYDRIKDAVRFAYTNWQNQKDDIERLQKVRKTRSRVFLQRMINEGHWGKKKAP